MASDLSFNLQLVSPGIVIPMTAIRTNSNLQSVKVDVSISDKKVNNIGTTMKTVTLNWNNNSNQFEGNLTLEYGDISGADYTTSFAIGGIIRGVSNPSFVSNIYPVHYMSPLKDVKIDNYIPGNKTITLLCSHDGSVENPHNMLAIENNVYIRKFYLDANKAPVFEHLVKLLVVDTTTYNDGRKHYKVLVDELTNETVHELAITMVNQVGPTAALTSVNATPSQYPAAMTFNSFNSLDASGGRFTIALDNQTQTVATFKTLKMNVSYTSAQVTVPSTVQTIDLSNNYPNPDGDKRILQFLMPANIKTALFQGSAFNKFTVKASLTADIQDGSGNVIKTLTGEQRSADYFMDRPLTVSSFSLNAIDWSSGKHTLKASILGGTNDMSYNSVTATFDMSGLSLADVTQTDICNNVTSAKIDLTYEQLSASTTKLSVKPKVKISRRELNVPEDATQNIVINTSPFLELSHVLAALKKGPAPTVEFDPLPTEATKLATFKFLAQTATPTEGFPDLSANTFYRIQLDEIGATKVSTIQDKIAKKLSQMTASGEIFTLSSSTISAGIRCVLRAFTTVDLTGYAPVYAALNKGEKYLTSAEVNKSAVFKGTPDVSLSLRPSAKTVDKLDTIRLSGNMKANNIDNLYLFGRDVCGGILYKNVPITSTTTDICGRRMTGVSGEDFAGVFTYDVSFSQAELPTSLSSDPVFLFAVVDTKDDIDKVVARDISYAVETDFVAKVAAISIVQATYAIAEDLSMNYKTKDALYKIIEASAVILDTSINSYIQDISNSSSNFNALITTRDGSGVGSKWAYDTSNAAAVKAKALYEHVYEHNLTQFNTIPTPSEFDVDHVTVTISAWRDVSTNPLGYVVSSKKLVDASNGNILGKPDNTINPGNYSPYHAFMYAKSNAKNARDAAFSLYLSTEIGQENATAEYAITTSAITNFNSNLADKQKRLDDLVSTRTTYTTAMKERAAVLVKAAADAQVNVNKAAADLATARLAFFDASGRVLW